MIKEINKEMIEEYVKFSWQISCNSNKNCFPKFKTYQEMYETFSTSIQNEDDKLLACYYNGELVGTLNLFVKKDYKILQGSIYAIKDFKLPAKEFINYLKSNYSGYEIYLGYPLENNEAINFLDETGACLIESSFTMELKKENFIKHRYYKEVKILEKNLYRKYADFHDKHNPTIYWTSERIFEKINLWKIYIITDNENIVGSIFIKSKGNKAEVFGLSVDEEYRHKGIELKILSESIYNMCLDETEEVLYFVDEDENDELEASLKVGFKQIDTYRCYKLIL